MAKVAREYDYYPAPQSISDEEMERRWAKAFGSSDGTIGKESDQEEKYLSQTQEG